MIKLDLYISKTLLLAVLMVLLVLGGLDLMFSLFDEIAATNDGYQIPDAITYSLLTFPRRIYELLPFSALIGSLAGLGVLASSNELMVMQAAGVKVSRIVWSVMKPTGLIMLVGLCLGEFVAPPLELKAEVGKAVANGQERLLSRYGFWERNKNEYIHFNAIEPGGLLHGIRIYELDENRRRVSDTVAPTAQYYEEGEESYWVLNNGRKTFFPDNSARISGSSVAFESLVWNVDLSPELLQVLIVDSDKMAISDLYRYAARFKSQGLEASSYLLAFWEKLLQPLATAALVLVAISFIFGPLREATMGSRVFTAICFGLVFVIVQRLFRAISLLYGFDPFIAAFLPIVLVVMIGMFMLRKAN